VPPNGSHGPYWHSGIAFGRRKVKKSAFVGATHPRLGPITEWVVQVHAAVSISTTNLPARTGRVSLSVSRTICVKPRYCKLGLPLAHNDCELWLLSFSSGGINHLKSTFQPWTDEIVGHSRLEENVAQERSLQFAYCNLKTCRTVAVCLVAEGHTWKALAPGNLEVETWVGVFRR